MNEPTREFLFYFNRRVGFFSSLLSRNPLKIRPVLEPMTHPFPKLAVTVILLAVCAAFSQAQKPARESDEVLTPVMTKGDLYPADADAKKEIDEALEKAVKDKKRVMLIFGANWCYDCHVLDRALHEWVGPTCRKGDQHGPLVDPTQPRQALLRW